MAHLLSCRSSGNYILELVADELEKDMLEQSGEEASGTPAAAEVKA